MLTCVQRSEFYERGAVDFAVSPLQRDLPSPFEEIHKFGDTALPAFDVQVLTSAIGLPASFPYQDSWCQITIRISSPQYDEAHRRYSSIAATAFPSAASLLVSQVALTCRSHLSLARYRDLRVVQYNKHSLSMDTVARPTFASVTSATRVRAYGW